MVARPLVCTGGPAERKHDQECHGICVQQHAQLIPGATSCVGSQHFRLKGMHGHYACRSADSEVAYHTPVMDDFLTKQRLWFIHRPCACNCMNALIGRVGKCVPQPDVNFVKTLQPLIQALADAVGRHPMIPYLDVYRNMGAKKRARYQRAEINLKRQGGLAERRDAQIKMFVKLEGIKFTDEKRNPDCRAIQFRSPEYTLQLAAHIKLAEHALYEISDVPGFGSGRLFAKNMNPVQRAGALRELMDAVPGGHMIELDASRFDAHVNSSLLEAEHMVWLATCLGPQLAELLRWQVKNRGSFRTRTDVGVFSSSYTVDGGRMSGDANTAAGNCIIMGLMLAKFLGDKRSNFRLLCDGDDSVVIHDGDVIVDLEVITYFRQFGMTMSIEARPERFEHINFCQAKPVFAGGRWYMQRDPFKILSKIGVSHKLGVVKARRSYLRTVAMGELALSRGCPVIQPFLAHLIEHLSQGMTARKKASYNKQAFDDSWRLRQWLPEDWREAKTYPVCNAARKSFENAWGICIAEQVNFERRIHTFKPSYDVTTSGQGVDAWVWEYPWRRDEVR